MKVSGFKLSLFSLFLSFVFVFLENSLVYSIFFSAIPIVFFYFSKKQYSINYPMILDSIKVFLIVGVLSVLVVIIFEALSLYDLDKVQQYVKENSMIILIAAIGLSPIMEELFFRAFLIELFSKFIKNDVVNALLSSSVFAVLHVGYGSLTELAGVFIIAIVFSYYYSIKKEIVPVIIAHLLFNTLSLLLYHMF